MTASVEFFARVDSAEIAAAYIERMARVHGDAAWLGHVQAKGWAGPRRPDLAADPAAGRILADLAA